MISIEEARKLALERLSEIEASSRQVRELRKDLSASARSVLRLGLADEILFAVINDDRTQEYDFGWLFFYRCVNDAGEPVDVFGYGPLIVDRHSGEVFETGSALDVDVYVKNYQQTGDPHRAGCA